MKRREFMILSVSVVVVRPGSSMAQSAPPPVVGFLNSGSPVARARSYAAFRAGLAEAGFVEGRNVSIEQRWADGDYAKLPEMASELVRRQVAVILAGGPPAPEAAKAATTTIPIVFTNGSDPVASGLVASLARPGGNITGFTLLSWDLLGKNLDLLRQLAPNAELFAVLINRANRGANEVSRRTQDAARRMGKRLLVLEASTPAEIDAAYASAARQGAGGMVNGGDPFLESRYRQITALAAKFAMPTITIDRRFPDEGGLMSHGANIPDTYRQAGDYVGRILKGAKPADLPVQQPTRFEFVINLKTAKALGLSIPPLVLAQADEVIE